ncbi:MAG: His Kinase A (phospho-acceptor) domain/Histidine kinase-, DNA gyrase B-, and HSP90-like ATPase/CHASE [Marinobacter excellens HL-55]|uniref:histidine kinase n=1 Tax=Marinobacter excellens HL-55 TaxID=1305731 RepID=A0A0P8B5X3_9GAMM|nr:MAG: His Kinase A (phospho-acceptor) domain/Histidine kinase-, DNA gyrase B-, and HSP90-like ATPase/CHASE [Marinobacter excellens HL-55]
MRNADDRRFRSLIWMARWMILILMLSVAIAVDRVSTERFRTEARQEWQAKIDDLALGLQGRILQNITTVWGLAANVSVEPELGEARFQELTAVIFRLATELRNIGLAPDFVINNIYPLEGNEAAIGLDLRAQSLPPEQVRMLMETERAVFSGPINLVQGGQGLAARIPIFSSDSGEFWGVVSVILDLQRLYEAVNLGIIMQEAQLVLSTSSDPTNLESVFFGTQEASWKWPVYNALDMHGTSWHLFAQPKTGWPDQPPQPWLLRGMLALLVLLVTAITFWLTRLLLKDRQMQQWFPGLFELAPVGIALFDASSNQLLRANPTLKSILGEHPRSLAFFNKTFDEYGNLSADCEDLTETLARSERLSGRQSFVKDNTGTLTPIMLHGLNLITTDGKPVVWLIVEDISEQKEAERLKNQFISTVSHELRTPLTSISGALGLLANQAAGPLPGGALRLTRIAHRNSEQLTYLVNDLLDIEKLIAGKMTFEMEAVRVSDLVRECVENIGNYASEHQVTVTIRQLADVEVTTDKRRLMQALNNLLSNAIKFSPGDSEVHVYTERHDHKVLIVVQDFGDGIPPEFEHRVFEKFAQAETEGRRSKAGTGLGLAITRELMLKMHGDVGFRSRPGQGATFWLELTEGERPPGRIN